MGDNNNHDRPPMLKAGVRPALPIVGQPFEIKGWFLTLMVACRCGANEPCLMAGQIGAVTMCPACRRVFVLKSINVNAGGQVEFQLQLAIVATDTPPGRPQPW